MSGIEAATADPPTRSIDMGDQAMQLSGQTSRARERDDTPITWWLQGALARKYDHVLVEPVPPDLEALLRAVPAVG